MATYNLFISHSWAYGENYNNLVKMLDAKLYFSYKNYSVPKDDPLHTRGSNSELFAAIKRQIQMAHIVIVLAGVYATYSKWINNEIQISQSSFQNRVPILAVEHWVSERTSTTVKDAANKIVGWNSDSIVGGVRELVQLS